jgi:hypothetical protein
MTSPALLYLSLDTHSISGPGVFGFPPTGRASPLLGEESQ